MATQIILPNLGEGVIEAQIGRWLKREGEQVQVDEPLVEIETDKVTTEVVSDVAGTLLKIVVPEGQMASVGSPLAVISVLGESVATNGKASAARQNKAKKEFAATARRHAAAGRPRISPIAKRIAQENDLEIAQIAGSGLHGRITKRDVEACLKQPQEALSPVVAPPIQPEPSTPSLKPAPAVQPVTSDRPEPVATAEGDTLTPLSTIRRAIAEHMMRSKQTSPHVTTVFEIDFSAVMANRRDQKESFARRGIHLTLTPYLLSATGAALRAHPAVNSQWTDEGILAKGEINLGMATAIPQGLIVPVIKNADMLNLAGLTRQVNDLGQRARNNQLKPDEVQGGTFTMTNHGVSGSLLATPVINQPQAGILGFGKIEKRVVVLTQHGQDVMAIRPLAYASFTFDHRILDGATADAFVAHIKKTLEEW